MRKSKIRCAIYTRKSTKDGLDHDFNSLDAQYEACAAYIKSQKQEGWRQLKQRYDDGGKSGGNLQRTALQELLNEVEAGRIDMILVYKIDRLTRSLADFAQLVARLDKANCSFVSVTQAFNTSSSMGRLTLNVLLSFAQFEREVTAERIRDKIAASKKKGMWMGGNIPLGYQKPKETSARRLEVNPQTAPIVHAIFDLYETHKCLSKARHQILKTHGIQRGFSRGRLYSLLCNPIYLGKIRHKTAVYEGLHEGIIGQDQFNRVQAILGANAARRRGQDSKGNRSSLIGKIFDETGDRLTPTHTNRNGRLYHYYISNRLISSGADPSAWRLKAQDLETALANKVKEHLIHSLLDQSLSISLPLPSCVPLKELIEGLTKKDLLTIISRVNLALDKIHIALNAKALSHCLNNNVDQFENEALIINTKLPIRRRSIGMKIIDATEQKRIRQPLIRALNTAHRWLDMLKDGTPISVISAKENLPESQLRKHIKLAFLSPSIQQAIVSSNASVDLTLRKVLALKIPEAWEAQDILFNHKFPDLLK